MTTYVAFDGDKDIWAYGYMKGWSANKRIDFELLDAHDLDNMTARAQGEYYVKGKLRERMNKSKAFVLLVGESTKHLRKYVGWEIDLAVTRAAHYRGESQQQDGNGQRSLPG
jgi:hypothetical protein